MSSVLRYLCDEDVPGIRRVRHGSGFVYFDPRGRKITDENTLARIRSIVIPPAWQEVWICPLRYGHIQATGRDARGRKQYRYHPLWRAWKDEAKYQQLAAFGRALPQIRRRVGRDLAKPGLPREKVLAAIVRLLERTMIRVGNDEYARANRSYGLTTLLDNHVRFYSGKLKFAFRGKSGIARRVVLRDPRLLRVVRHCQDIPGQTLFQYYDDDGKRRRVGSGDVNDYLRQISGVDFTAKFFRTWGGTLIVMCALMKKPAPRNEREAKRQIAEAVRDAAHQLGNTTTVCRKYYVHPAVIDAYESGRLARARSREQSYSRERLLMSILSARRSAPLDSIKAA
jgi:DNA topoisomerase I